MTEYVSERAICFVSWMTDSWLNWCLFMCLFVCLILVCDRFGEMISNLIFGEND